MHRETDDMATLAAVGVLAVVIAALAHEVLGHAGACLAAGGDVTLLTAIWFRCSPASAWVDSAGPLAGLLAGAVGLTLAGFAPRSAVPLRLFGLLLGSYAGFWFCAQLVSQVLLRQDDWSFTARWAIGWRILLISAAVAGYGVLIRVIRRLAGLIAWGRADRKRFLLPHAAGALAMVSCAALRPDDGSAVEMALTVAVAPLGYVWAVTRPFPTSERHKRPLRSWPWVLAGLTTLTVYGFVFGPGIGPLACPTTSRVGKSALRHIATFTSSEPIW